MGGGRWLAAVIATITTAALGTAAPARAAHFTLVPPLYVQPTAAPFEFGFAADDPGALVAYNVSTNDLFWQRCSADPTLTLSGLAEGAWKVTIADDPTPCTTPFNNAPGTPETQRMIRRRRPPPTFTNVAVQHSAADPADVQVDAATIDLDAAHFSTGSGVQSLTWLPGDGSPAVQATTLTHRYPPGRSTGTVTAIDRAGNAATRRFIVNVAGVPARLTPRLRWSPAPRRSLPARDPPTRCPR